MIRPVWYSTGQPARGEAYDPHAPTPAAIDPLIAGVLRVAAADALAGSLEARAFVGHVCPRALDYGEPHYPNGAPLRQERQRAA